MRRTALRAALAVATVAGIAISSSAAFAESATDWESGLTFYSGNFVTPVANFPVPDGQCHAFPATAGTLVGWSNFENVIAYRTADCTGQQIWLGTLRSFRPGEFASFSAY
ncbi:hypothetical protein HRD49_22240 [Corallococcus exiguus]|uniref:hypothetical protein n=1 Tax=Corallococcus TaxID=83461 RepID=UPI000EA2C964|nr:MULTISPECIES: hypothetical protein [Corallococcus]NNC19661.1 hypothetical protein [Corallococcus exiguus]NRD53927.1 hypothetical protein [Corallococcus exiguus]NRD64477.1 hypothetical protein [Corallococcus exiguus]RKH22678.1 hypothetical protein D7V77_26380 [Corallococcus sp. CA041A]RKI06001.1 hypothetical protein D7Y15_31985 [Corallococcus sp. AB030]